ncbi:MAG: hypothetical protein ABIF82_11915 [Planctomycetota bacterium]
MSEMWEQHKPFTVSAIVWVGGAFLFLFAVHMPLAGPVSALRDEAARGAGLPGRADLEKHYASPAQANLGAALFAQVETSADKERTALDTELMSARELIEFRPKPEFIVAADAAQRAYEYTRIRDALAPRLRELANKASVKMPHEIDPRLSSKALPSESETDELLFRLAMTDRIVRSAVAAGVGHVAEIKHDLGAQRGKPFAERRVEVKLVCGLDELIGFVGRCSLLPAENAAENKEKPGGGILVVRSAAIANEKERSSVLTARVTLAAVTATKIETPESTKAETRKTRRAHRSF